MSAHVTKNSQPFDQEIQDIVDYALNYEVKSEVAYKTAWSCLLDTIGCGLESLEYPACTKLLGPLVPGTRVEKGVRVPGTNEELNPELQKATRLADFLELGELMALDALKREESCGGHFREEFQTPEGEAMRNDKDFAHVAAWEYKGTDNKPELHKESLEYEFVELKQRNYK